MPLLSLPGHHDGVFLAVQTQLIATAIVVAAAALTATVGVPRLLQRQHQDEALRELARLSKAASVYFVKPKLDAKTSMRALCAFPPGEIRTTLAKSCCDPKVSDGEGLCDPGKIEWNRTLWGALKWKLSEPHAFIYEYKGVGELGAATFTVSAYGDLDCDGQYATFRYTGRASAQSRPDDCLITEAPVFEAINPGE